MRKRHYLTALAMSLIGLGNADAPAEDWALQTNFAPIFIPYAPHEGAHPLGGPTMRFVGIANKALAPFDHRLVYHASGGIPESDKGRIYGPVADMTRFTTIYSAVAAGRDAGGVDFGVGISNQNGLSFGELHVAALPFGLEPDEFAAYLYDGGGLALQQELYDKNFARSIVVLPIAITPTQGGGWFPEALPDPGSDPDPPPDAAMRELCGKPWIVRWPEPGAGIWQHACTAVDRSAAEIGPRTRCAKSDSPCPSEENPVGGEIDRLSFGGFVPGIPPHVFVMTGNIDAYELNLPSTEILMIRLATGQADVPSEDADLRAIVEAAPFYYGQTWHQPLTYLELLINRTFWDGLTDAERFTIRIAAESATLRNWTAALSRQGSAIDLLEKSGAKVGQWPQGLLSLLRASAEAYLDEKSSRLAAEGDVDYGRVLDHMRSFQRAQQVYADFGDLNQGRGALPTSLNRQ
jgi:hypothetical protein